MGTPKTLWRESKGAQGFPKADFTLKWPGGGTILRHEAAARCGA